MEPLTAKLEEMGVVVEEGDEHIRVYMPEGGRLCHQFPNDAVSRFSYRSSASDNGRALHG